MDKNAIVLALEAASRFCFSEAQGSMKEGSAQYEAIFTELAESLQSLADQVNAL